MRQIKLKTQFEFDSAHRLVGYSGKCNQLHGHLWRVELEIIGDKKDLDEIGILWDFSLRKKLVDIFDHKTILKDCEENRKLIKLLWNMTEKNSVYLMNENPTAENLCYEILKLLTDINLKFKVIVWESPKSSCEVESK